MRHTSEIISKLSLDERKKFVNYLKKKNRRGDVKNIELFYLLANNDDKPDEVLYAKSSKNAFHALNKRLFDSLIDFISIRRFEEESSDEMEVIKYLLSSRFLFERGLSKIAFKTVKKAEQKAIESRLYTLLNETYAIKIQNAHIENSIDLDLEIEKYNINKRRIEQEETLNLFYACVQRDLLLSETDVTNIISNHLRNFNITIGNGLSYTSLLKIIEISNEVAKISRDYISIISFVEDTCEKLEQSSKPEKNLKEHIQLLYYLANFQFRNKNFNKAQGYLASMKLYMEQEKFKYFDHFNLKFLLLNSLLEIFNGNAYKVPAILSLNLQSSAKNDVDILFEIQLTKIIALFFLGEFKTAFKEYKRFYHSDVWYHKKVGLIWVIQKNLIELLLLLELDEFDLFYSRLISFRKKHKTVLIQHQEGRVLEFLQLVSIYYKDQSVINDNKFKNRVDRLLEQGCLTEDIFTICFYSWLSAKIEKKNVYVTCLKNIVA